MKTIYSKFWEAIKPIYEIADLSSNVVLGDGKSVGSSSLSLTTNGTMKIEHFYSEKQTLSIRIFVSSYSSPSYYYNFIRAGSSSVSYDIDTNLVSKLYTRSAWSEPVEILSEEHHFQMSLLYPELPSWDEIVNAHEICEEIYNIHCSKNIDSRSLEQYNDYGISFSSLMNEEENTVYIDTMFRVIAEIHKELKGA